MSPAHALGGFAYAFMPSVLGNSSFYSHGLGPELSLNILFALAFELNMSEELSFG
jgi:hypothetical protein